MNPLFKVTLPVCLPAILDIATYLFVNALTTTSAVVFLYSTDTIPASVSILNMDPCEGSEIEPETVYVQAVGAPSWCDCVPFV